MTHTFRTNVIGPQIMGDAFAPLLKKSASTPRILNVSSGVGSIEKRLDPTGPIYNLQAVQYRATKSALNMVMACQAVEYGKEGFKVFAYCPGFCVSNLGPQNKSEFGAKPTSEGAAPMVDILNGKRDAEHAGFLHETGQYPW